MLSSIHWRAKLPDTYAIALNIGPYELLQADYTSRFGNTIPLRFWYLKGNEVEYLKADVGLRVKL